MTENYKERLKQKMDTFVHLTFSLTKDFPKTEIYITTSQLKRAALSIILNYVEGFARIKKGNQLQFLETSYGSLKETKYLLYFSAKESFLTTEQYNNASKIIDEIGAMLWTEISALNKSLDN